MAFARQRSQNFGQYSRSGLHYFGKVPEAGPRTNFKVVVGGQETGLSNQAESAKDSLPRSNCFEHRLLVRSTSDFGCHSSCPMSLGCCYPIKSFELRIQN